MEYNLHLHAHMKTCILEYGPVYTFWLYSSSCMEYNLLLHADLHFRVRTSLFFLAFYVRKTKWNSTLVIALYNFGRKSDFSSMF